MCQSQIISNFSFSLNNVFFVNRPSILGFTMIVLVLLFTWIFGAIHFGRTSSIGFGCLFIIGNVCLVSFKQVKRTVVLPN